MQSTLRALRHLSHATHIKFSQVRIGISRGPLKSKTAGGAGDTEIILSLFVLELMNDKLATVI